MIFAILTILLITIGALPDAPLQYKYLALLAGGLIAIITLYQRNYFPLAVIASFMLIHIIRPMGMNSVSLVQFTYLICFMGLAYFCHRNIPHGVIEQVICFSAILQALYGILQIWYDPLFTVDPGYITATPENAYRIFGTFGNRQYWLMYLFASVPLFFSQRAPSWCRHIGLPILSLAYIGYLVVTRGAVGFVEITAFIAILVWYARQRIVFAIPILVTILFFLYAFIWPQYRDTGLAKHLAESVQMRAKAAALSYQLVTDTYSSTILGYGLGTYGIIMPIYEKQSGAGITPERELLAYTHNEYLQTWFELGLGGLVLMLIMFAYIVWRAYTSIEYAAWWFSLLVIGIFSWVHFPLHLPQTAVFFLRGIDFRAGEMPKGFYSGCPQKGEKL